MPFKKNKSVECFCVFCVFSPSVIMYHLLESLENRRQRELTGAETHKDASHCVSRLLLHLNHWSCSLYVDFFIKQNIRLDVDGTFPQQLRTGTHSSPERFSADSPAA